ncbi:MAG: aminodeoxychorismate lyase [Alphaproteobacteria bacterium]|nr:MAG: aminodeoxychorismate lyase [Alphaproteobacteria bacterium]
MKFILGLCSFSFLLILGAALGVMGLLYTFQTAGPLAEDTVFQVKRGQGVRQIARDLETQNIIINQYPFMAGAKLKNSGKPIQAGEYEIVAGASIASILNQMQSGKVLHRRLTIPEGKTSYEIIQILNQKEGLQGAVKSIPPEGSLLPETYAYSIEDTRLDKISQMQEAMNNALNTAWNARVADLPFTSSEEALILASIVEKETARADEYAKVAGVFINRLRKGMKLQTDPTVIYGITKGRHKNEGRGPLGRRLLTKDLRKDTPYNTYTRKGLPPTPICNPGKAAIEAVMNPATHDYIFFVADGTGGHAFAKTLAQHNANVAKWRKIRK